MAKKPKRIRAATKPFRVRKVIERIPENLEQAQSDVASLKLLLKSREELLKSRQQQVDELQTNIASLQEETKRELLPIVEEAKHIASRVYKYVKTHREELTRGGTYASFTFAGLDVGKWIKSTFVSIPDEEAFIKEALRRELDIVLRTKHEPDKEAIKQHPELTLKTASVEEQEKFAFVFGSVEDRIEAVVSRGGQLVWNIRAPDKSRKKE